MTNTEITWEDTVDPSGCNCGIDHYADRSCSRDRCADGCRVVGWASPSSLTVALASIGGGETTDEIGPGAFLQTTEAGAVVLDVRTTGEVARGAIEGSVRVPYTRLLDHIDALPQDQPILVFHMGLKEPFQNPKHVLPVMALVIVFLVSNLPSFSSVK